MFEKTLKKLGLQEKEVRVYLSLLKLGSDPVRKIAEEAELNRSTAHDILNKLIAEGLASFLDKTKHRYFTAEPPEHILSALKIRKDRLEETEREIQKILPELKSLYEKSESRPKARYFEGEVGLRSILKDVLNSVSRTVEKQYYVFSSSTIRETVHRAFPGYNQERTKLGISVKTISIGPGGGLHGLDERKWLSEKEGSPTYTLIYANKVALISLENSHPIGVVIEDKNTYQTQVMIFKALWEKL